MDIGFDFFLFIAFLIPGIFILFSLSLSQPLINRHLNIRQVEKDGKNWILILSVATLLGMMSSILRNVIIDKTFSVDLSYLPFVEGKPAWIGISRVEPLYANLTENGLNNLRELKNEEKRPYQFYGNMLIALSVLLVCLSILVSKENPNKQLKRFAILWSVYLFAAWLLYIGSRFSYYNYMHGVKSINDIEQKRCSKTL